MNYLDAYTTYALSTIAAITVCAVYGALFCAYGVVKVRKGSLFWTALSVQICLFSWLAARLLWLVSPSLAHRSLYLSLQTTACLLLVPPLSLFPLGMYRSGIKGTLLFAYGTVLFVVLAGIAYSLVSDSGILRDLIPILCFVVWNAFVGWNRRDLFAELSDVSIDAFMRRLEDMVVVFDPNGRLMDSNESARGVFALGGETILWRGFLDEVNKMIVTDEKISPRDPLQQEEIGLALRDGVRYYRRSATLVTNRKNAHLATVLIFHDITERIVLQKELEGKIAELGRLNKEYQVYLETAGRLDEEREKALAAKHIQEVIGGRISRLLDELEALDMPGSEGLPSIIQDCRDVMASIRLAVKKLMSAGERDEEHDQGRHSGRPGVAQGHAGHDTCAGQRY